jgi:hypothetical protein
MWQTDRHRKYCVQDRRKSVRQSCPSVCPYPFIGAAGCFLEDRINFVEIDDDTNADHLEKEWIAHSTFQLAENKLTEQFDLGHNLPSNCQKIDST